MTQPTVKIRCISLWEPWATAMAIGLKSYETRHWKPNLQAGTLVAIHAAARKPTRDDMEVAHAHGFADALKPGHILSVHRFDGTHATAWFHPGNISRIERSLGNYAFGRFAWHMPLVHRLEKPIPYKGQQGFFSVELPEFCTRPNEDR